MIAITFALPAESSRLVGRTEKQRRAACADSEITYGEIEQRSVAIFHTGVGHEVCQRNIRDFLRTARPDLLISSGFAGGARADLRVGSLFLAANFSDQQLVSAAQRVLTDRPVHTANLFTSMSIIDSVSQRTELERKTNAAAVDMETETIAQACAAFKVRMLSLRVISDSLNDPLPAPPEVLFDVERQKTDYGKLSQYVLRHPATLWDLVRFAWRIAEARKVLTQAILDLLRSL